MKAEVIIEQFDNGISLKWDDSEGKFDPSRKIASDSEKEKMIGDEIWSDIERIFNETCTNKVLMTIEYRAMEG